MKIRIVGTVLGLLAAAVAGASAPPAAAGVTIKPHSLQKLFDSYGNASTGDRWTGGALLGAVKLPDGRTAYSFGFTYLGKVNKNGSRDASTKRINSSWVIQEKNGKLSKTLTGSGQTDFYAAPAPQTFYEPSGAVVVGNKLYQLLYLRGYGDQPDTMTSTVHADVATISLPDFRLESIQHTNLMDSNTVQTGDQEWPVEWGSGAMNEGAYTYIWGVEQTQFAFFGHLARVPIGQLTAMPEYWDGAKWSQLPVQSARIFGGGNNGYTHLSVTKIPGGVRVVTQGFPAGATYHDVYAFTAKTATGPYTASYLTTMQVPAEAGGIALRYWPTEVSTLGNAKTIVFAYLRDGGGAARTANVANYRPVFLQATVTS